MHCASPHTSHQNSKVKAPKSPRNRKKKLIGASLQSFSSKGAHVAAVEEAEEIYTEQLVTGRLRECLRIPYYQDVRKEENRICVMCAMSSVYYIQCICIFLFC